MYRQQKRMKCVIKQNTSYTGETIEQKVNRISNNKEPIKDGAPLIYTERQEGVQPQYNIRTDRFEIAIDAMDKVDATHKAKREQRIGEKTYDTMTETEQAKFNEKFPNNKHNKQNKGEGTSASTNDKPE